MKIREYVRYDGLGLADLVRRREVTREEVVAAAIDVARLQNPKINAICHEAYEQALQEARAKDDDRSSGGPFDGVPFLLKDAGGAREGWPQRMGSRAFEDQISPFTATLTQRYLDAGVIPLGKTTVPEFGLIAVNESELYGDTRNPWNLDHTPGASSGG